MHHNSSVPENSRKHLNAVNPSGPLPEIPKYSTRSSSRPALLKQFNRPTPTPPRTPDFRQLSIESDLVNDENLPPTLPLELHERRYVDQPAHISERPLQLIQPAI